VGVVALKLRTENNCELIMAAWSSRKLLRDVFLKRGVLNRFSGGRGFSSAPENAPKIGYYSKKVCVFIPIVTLCIVLFMCLSSFVFEIFNQNWIFMCLSSFVFEIFD
jgi:hypothetical protein